MTSQPALPLEIIRIVFRLAEFVIPCPGCPPTARTVNSVAAHANGSDVDRVFWFESAPFTNVSLSRLATIRLSTFAKHQGWVSQPDQGSWSWFEVAILNTCTPST